MGIGINHFKNFLKKLNVEKQGNGYSLKISFDRFGQKMDKAQDALDAQVWMDMQKYMPLDTGNLIADTANLNNTTRGEVYLYPPYSDYGHYQYEGIKYVDPEYGIGAFYDPDYGFWSRKGVKKEPSNEPLFYGRDTAEAHWDEAAYRDNKKKWEKVAKRALKG